MKQYLSTALALACLGLVLSLALVKRGDDTQQEADAAAIADLSNQLWSAQTQIAIDEGALLVVSNRLTESRSAVLQFSNELINAGTSLTQDAEQITNLNQQIAQVELENQSLQTASAASGRRVMELTNQMAGLTREIASTQARLDRADREYGRLENRFRRDVAERVVVERKFNNLPALKAQMQNLKRNPARQVSADQIYGSLDVEVKSNAFYVIAPD